MYSEDFNQLTIAYGCNQERVQEDFLNTNTGQASTIYFASNYEKEVNGSNTYEVHYIKAEDGVCALYVITNGVGKMFYAYKDHLGSIVALTNDQGQTVARQSFDAWGRPRNAIDWTYNPQTSYTSPLWLHRGLTGHEHLLSFGLINMNGRVYDPIV